MENEENQEVELDEETNEEEVEEEVEEVEEEEAVEEDDTDWKAEALKYKAIAVRNKKKSINKNIKTKAESPDEVVDRLSSLELAEKKRQFGYEHGLSPKEADAVFKIDSNPTADTLKDPFLKGGLDAIKRQARLDGNTPSTSAKSAPLDRKKMKDMTPEQKQEAYDKYMKSLK